MADYDEFIYEYREKIFLIRRMPYPKNWVCVVPGWYYEDSLNSEEEAIEIAVDYIERNFYKL